MRCCRHPPPDAEATAGPPRPAAAHPRPASAPAPGGAEAPPRPGAARGRAEAEAAAAAGPARARGRRGAAARAARAAPRLAEAWRGARAELRAAVREFARGLAAEGRGTRRLTSEMLCLMAAVLVLQVALVGFVALAYYDSCRSRPEIDPARRGADMREWSSGLLLGCCSEPRVLFWSLACPCVRWADSMHTVGIMSFWCALWLSTLAVLMTELTFGIFGVAVIAGLFYFRQRLRRRFKMESSASTYAADCLALCCCLPCALAQDARHVEEGCLVGDPAIALHLEFLDG
ncbi:unnamed protein product [Prorocentrum cordatum]|uniref:Copper transporter n=1 Tax=Prorocentrum cordatum TaxID=2364126 RepID=A0ABN9Q967_9DINO|nr:unnamed protein product [Polarella glacialis]